MKLRRSAPLLASAIVLVAACSPQDGALPRAADVPESDMEKQSYALGNNMGQGLKAANIEFERAQFNAGFYDAIDGEQRMTDEDIQAAIVALQTTMQAKQAAAQEEQSAANISEGKAYLAQNGQAEGVVTTESGLQYKVLQAAEGTQPNAEDIVTVHYEGRLLSGEVFDSSVQRGEPATFPLNGVIAGWTEGLQLMPVGAKWQFTIPADLAYGERGAGPKIKPHSVLIFDVELLAIEAPAVEETATAEQ
jgi:FKBP-type peptidyl-prolyl cis-trans isomerase